MVIVLPNQCHSGVQLCLWNGIRTGQNDGGSGLNLVVVELTKVLHIHLDLAGIRHRNGMSQPDIFIRHLFHRRNHIRELTNARGLNNNPVRGILRDHLLQGFAEITHQAAANAAGVHFRDVDTGILQKAAVNANFTKLVFDEYQLFALIGFLNHLFNQCRLAGSQKAGVNVNACHIRQQPFCQATL